MTRLSKLFNKASTKEDIIEYKYYLNEDHFGEAVIYDLGVLTSDSVDEDWLFPYGDEDFDSLEELTCFQLAWITIDDKFRGQQLGGDFIFRICSDVLANRGVSRAVFLADGCLGGDLRLLAAYSILSMLRKYPENTEEVFTHLDESGTPELDFEDGGSSCVAWVFTKNED